MGMLDLKNDVNLSCKLQMTLAPRLLEMLKILNLPFCEMVQKVEAAAEENPLLEIERLEVIFEYVKYLNSGKKINLSEYDGLKNVAAASPDLRSHLLEQLKLTNLSGTERSAAEELVENIDENGYLLDFDKISKKISKRFSLDADQVERILKIIQGFEPDGVGARDLSECLLIQIEEYSLNDPEIEDLLKQAVKNYLPLLGEKKYREIAAALGVEEEDIVEIGNFIKNNLNPYPASDFSERARTVIPSFAVELKDEKIAYTNLEARYGPKLKISSQYEKMLKDPRTDEKTVKFLKTQFEKAVDMIENLEKREETGNRIMSLIIERQAEYFEKGKIFRPLQQNEIAQILGLHPSTISRAVAEKYVQTPKGMFPMKYFCPRGLSGASLFEIEEAIKNIISAEEPSDPMSDEKIRGKLLERGVDINKRTIAIHRKAIGISSFKERKR